MSIQEIPENFIRDASITGRIRGAINGFMFGDNYKKPKDFLLVLMRSDGYVKFLQGVKPGYFGIKTKGRPEVKTIPLTPNKQLSFNYGKNLYVKGWIADEDNASTYPNDPLHTAREFKKFLTSVSLNYKDVNTISLAKQKNKFTLTLILGIAAVIVIVFTIPGLREAIFDAFKGEVTNKVAPAIDTVVQNVTNATQAIIDKGVPPK